MPAHKTAEIAPKRVRTARSAHAKTVADAVADAVLPLAEQSQAAEAEVFAVDAINASFLESLLGYNARRASLSLVGVFMRCMESFDLKVVEFSVLSLVASNPGITSRQLCKELDLLPPNMAVMMDSLVQRGYVQRRPHPSDGRATGLYLSPQGEGLIATAQPQLKASEEKAVAHLSEAEQKMLIELLRKLYH